MRRVGSRERIGSSRSQGPMMGILLRVSLRSKTNQSSRRYYPTKFLLMSQRFIRIGCLTLDTKEEKVVVDQVVFQNAPNVVRSTWVTMYWIQIIVFVVERVGKWLGIFSWTIIK